MKLLTDFKTFLNIKGALALISGMFLYGMGTGILAPMNAVYMRDGIGLSKVEIASVFASSLLLNMITTVSIGMTSDRMKRKKPLPIAACVLCMTGLLLYMHAATYWQTLLSMAIIVGPSGLIMGQLFAIARSHFLQIAPGILEMAQIWLRAMFSVGFFTGLLAGANLYLISSFHGILWGNFGGYACLMLLLFAYKEYPVSTAKTVQKGETFSLVMLLALLLLACGDSLRGLYLPLVVVHLFKKPELMSYLWSVQAVFELVFMTIAGYLAARYGSKLVILLGSLFALICYVIYASSPPLTVFFLVQPLYSFYVSILFGVAMGYVQRMFVSRVGFGSSLYVFLLQTASLIGYFLPFLIQGYEPRIFIIPGVLVAMAGLLMIGNRWAEKRKIPAAAAAGSVETGG